MIKFRCPHCNQKMGVPDDYANRRVRCSKCSQPSRVPAATNTDMHPKAEKTAASQAIKAVKTKPPAVQKKQELVEIQLQTRIKPVEPVDDVMDMDELETVDEEAARLEAVRQARQIQQQKRQASGSGGKSKRPGRTKIKAESGGGFAISSIFDFVPDILRLPLGLAASVVAAAAMIGIWIMASRATSNALGFMAVFVPLAAAAGIRLFAVERTFLWALLATVIGGLGLIAGKAAIAQYVVIPYCQNIIDNEVLEDLDAILADEKFQLPQGESAKFVAQDGDFMQCVALISLVDDGLADPVAARKWALHILLASNKTNVYAHLMSILGSGPDAPPMPEIEGGDEAMFAQASTRLFEWYEEEIALRKARQYFAALNYIATQANLQRILEKPDTAFKYAFLDTLGLLDGLWIMLGMGLAYATAAMD